MTNLGGGADADEDAEPRFTTTKALGDRALQAKPPERLNKSRRKKERDSASAPADGDLLPPTTTTPRRATTESGAATPSRKARANMGGGAARANLGWGAATASMGGGAATASLGGRAATASLGGGEEGRPQYTHEARMLLGRSEPKRSADCAVRAKPPEQNEERGSASAAGGADRGLPREQRLRSAPAREESVLSLADDVACKPRISEAMLTFIQQKFGGQPMDVLRGAGDELLIKDFLDAGDPAVLPSQEEVMGVAVEFEEDEKPDFDQVQDDLAQDHVPALKHRPYGTDNKIVKISEIPGWAQPAFAGMQHLNGVQSKVYDTALFKPDNILLCAPTGAGKSNVQDDWPYGIQQCMAYTYLYIQMLWNPTMYGLPPDIMETDKTLDERRADLVHSAANLLDKNNLVKYDRKTGYFQVTALGRIASYYYISHGTISTYNEYLKPTMGDIEPCGLFSPCEEFKYVSVRQDETMELAKLLDRVPISVKESLKEPSAKINVLLQAFYISRLKLEGLSLGSDMVYIRQSSGRLLRALFEIVLKRGWAQLAEKALNLCKMIDKQMWSVQTPLRQFPGIPKEILMKLEKKELAGKRYYDLSSQEIGELIRFPKMGKQLHRCIHQLPNLNLSAHLQPITRTVLGFELTTTPDFQWDEKVHGYVEPFWVIVEDNDGEYILHHEYFMLKKQYVEEDHTLHFTVPIYQPLPPQYFIRVVSDKWLGSQTILPICFRHLILPEKYTPPTELLDLQPLPVTALRNARYEGLYSAFKHFNPIQTQVFTVLYNSDDSVWVAAPTGSGKTICAEFAILRNHQKAVSGETNMRVVYIAPIEALAKERFRDWSKKFGEFAGVVELTGETAADLKLLDKGEIIISTPEKWDALSRRWKQRKHIQQVSLFIVDELQPIGSEKGHVLEIVVSRMRLISSHIGSNIRIVALSASHGNAKDLGDVIGATSHGLFNFPPAVRPVPLEIHIQGVDLENSEARMQAMAKPTHTAITQHAKSGKPALVFVPTCKPARLTALDLCAYSSAEGGETPFLGSKDEMDTFIGGVNEERVENTLRCGIGYLQEGSSDLDQELATQLILGGRIHNLPADIMETEKALDERRAGLVCHELPASEVPKSPPKEKPTNGSLLPRSRRLLAFLLLLLLLSCGGRKVAAYADGAWCDARSLSIKLGDECDVLEESQTEACCDTIFATLGREGCLCKVAEEPEFQSSGMASGKIIVDMYKSCDGGPYVSPRAVQECEKVGSPPPQPPPPPPPPPSASKEKWRPPHQMPWTKTFLIVGGAFVLLALLSCGAWALYMRCGRRWSAEGRGHRLGGEVHWWSAWWSKLKERSQDVRNMVKQMLHEGRGWFQAGYAAAAAPMFPPRTPPAQSALPPQFAPTTPKMYAPTEGFHQFAPLAASDQGCVAPEVQLGSLVLSPDGAKEQVKKEGTVDSNNENCPGTPLRKRGKNQ